MRVLHRLLKLIYCNLSSHISHHNVEQTAELAVAFVRSGLHEICILPYVLTVRLQ